MMHFGTDDVRTALDRSQAVIEFAIDVVLEGREDVLLAVEIVEEGAARDVRRLGDGVERRRLEALFEEQPQPRDHHVTFEARSIVMWAWMRVFN